MFSVTENKVKQYKEYTLKDLKAGTKAVIVPERGGTLSSFTLNSEEFIYLDEENFYGEDRPRCGMPVLFPCCGRSENEKVFLEGKEYPMPIHGIAHTSPWCVKEFSEENCSRITLEFKADDFTRKYYPYEFKVTYTYELKGNKLTVRQNYKNEGNKDMPFGFGFHPYFNISDVENVEVDVKAEVGINCVTGEKEPVINPVVLPREPMVHRAFLGAKDRVVSRDNKTGNQIEVNFDEYCANLILWSITENNFLCIEPWNDMPNALNTGAKNTLKPGEELNSSMSITISKFNVEGK